MRKRVVAVLVTLLVTLWPAEPALADMYWLDSPRPDVSVQVDDMYRGME